MPVCLFLELLDREFLDVMDGGEGSRVSKTGFYPLRSVTHFTVQTEHQHKHSWSSVAFLYPSSPTCGSSSSMQSDTAHSKWSRQPINDPFCVQG